MSVQRTLMMMLILLPGLVVMSWVKAQDSVDSIMEQARAQAREIEKMKKILNEEPDQNVRLAAFELMVDNGDPTMHTVAVEAGLASADKLLQAAAFRAAIMNLDRLHLVLAVDPDASEAIQQKSRAYVEKNGSALVLSLTKKDRKAGTFSSNRMKGEVTGTHLTFVRGRENGTLELKDDDAVTGKVTLYSAGYLNYLATGKIR